MDGNVTTLTPLERLQLVNQYEMLEKMDPEHAEEYARKRRILEEGYTILYPEIFQGIDDEVSVKVCRYVFEVLDMHRALRQSFDALADKEGLTLDDLRFKGFDGNDETNEYSFITYLQEEGRRWTESLADCDLNTHYPTAARYKTMLEKWHSLGDIRQRFHLTAAQIKEITGAS